MNKMNYGCEGLCVVISGGTSGIGLAAALRFLADGARVYILGRSKERGAQALCYLDEQTGKQAVYISCDVTKQAECKAAVAKLPSRKAGLIGNWIFWSTAPAFTASSAWNR